MKTALIVVAAGKGLRMGEKVKKQYLLLKGRPVLYHTIAACLLVQCFDQIVVVVSGEDTDYFKREILFRYFHDFKPVVTIGGEQRQDSVYNGILALNKDCDTVCVHDGARPLVTSLLLNHTVQEARSKGAVVTAVPVKDTIKRTDENGEQKVLETLCRNNLWSVQTPQAFRRDWLEEAHRRAKQEKYYATDDAALLEHYGYPVYITGGDYNNIKITTPGDLALAEILLGR